MPRRSRKRRWPYRASRSTSESDRATAVAKLRPSTPRSDRPAALQRRPTTGASPLSDQATVKLRFGRASVETPPAPSPRLPNARETYPLSSPNPMSDPHPPLRHPGESRDPWLRRTRQSRAVIPRSATIGPGVRRDDGEGGGSAIKSHPQSRSRGVRPAAARTRSPRTRSDLLRSSPPPHPPRSRNDLPPPSSRRKPGPMVTADPAIPCRHNPVRYHGSRRPPG